MGRAFMLRVNAAFLAGFFFCGAIVLPEFDAILYHGLSGQQENRPHVEAKGSLACHGESCVLSIAASHTKKLPSAAGRPVRDLESAIVALLPRSIAPKSAPAGLSNSRAPPVTALS